MKSGLVGIAWCLALTPTTVMSDPTSLLPTSEESPEAEPTQTENGDAKTETEETEPGSDSRVRLRVYPFQTAASKIELSRQHDRYSQRFGVPASAEVVAAELHLVFQNTADIDTRNSLIRVAINGKTVANLRPAAVTGPAEAKIQIPTNQLQNNANTISVEAFHVHRFSCTLENVFDMISEFNMDKTWITLTYENDFPDLTLRNLETWLQSGAFGRNAVRFVRLPGRWRESWLTSAALAAQGLATRAGQRGLPMTVRAVDAQTLAETGSLVGFSKNKGKGLDVLIGTAERLRPVIGRQRTEQIEGPHLDLRSSPSDPTTATLIVSGLTQRDVEKAARDFATADVAPELLQIAEQRLDRGTTRFDQLGIKTRTIKGIRGEITEHFFLPADYLPGETRSPNAEIRLRYNHAEELDPSGNVLVSLNGDVIDRLPLDYDIGKGPITRTIQVPMDKFRPGRNRLTLEAKLPSRESGKCAPVVANSDGRFTIFGSSTIRFRKYTQLVRMPNLHLTASTGYPYTVSPEKILDIYVMKDDKAVGTALTLLSQLRQYGSRTTSVKTHFEEPEHRARNQLHLALASDLPDSIFQNNPVSRRSLEVAFQNTPADGTSSPDLDSGGDGETVGPFEGAWDQFIDTFSRSSASSNDPTVNFAAQVAILQQESARGPGKTVSTVTVAKAEDWDLAISRLANDKVWQELDGAATFIGDSPQKIATVPRDNAYMYHIRTGPLDERALTIILGDWFSAGILSYILFVVVACFLFAYLTNVVVGRNDRNAYRE